jgi:hypothetical protein
MNEQFKATFGTAPPALPLRQTGNVVQGNATRKDWLDVCPPATRIIQKQKIFDLATVVPVLGTEIVPDDQAETYIVGNPPYLGRAQQSKDQKADIIHVFSGITKKFKNLDYVACWTLKAASYCQTIGAECAFVTTNSICQGEQVALLWPLIYQRELEISFAHQSFKWRNNAAKNAGVTCIIVGIRPIKKSIKRLYQDNFARIVDNISPYLIEGSNLIVTKTRKSLSSAPVMISGSMPNDGGHLILNDNERNALITDFPESAGIIRTFIGSSEFVRGNSRHCLWISDNQI